VATASEVLDDPWAVVCDGRYLLRYGYGGVRYPVRDGTAPTTI
jgi:hypothetical protein